jgi:MoaA/NifB/PqqE/SkfB family radical SAM enzyme
MTLETRPPLRYVEYDIVDHCNLNCVHCGHFSHLKPRSERSVEHILEDLRPVTRKFLVEKLRIMGGEPLLHGKLPALLRGARDLFGSPTTICLVTNGMLIPKMPQAFFDAARSARIRVEVSRYDFGPIDYDRVHQVLTRHGVEHLMSPLITHFANPLDLRGDSDPERSFETCRKIFNCPFYVDGRFHVCSIPASVDFLNRTYGERHGFRIEESFISIEESAEAILAFLDRPGPTCRFCHGGTKPYEPWRRSTGPDDI